MRAALRERIGQLLARETAGGRFIPEIDGLRFVAIWSVVLFHLYVFIVRKLGLDASQDGLARVLSKGAIGVQLFFVISGFIISLPFARAYRAGQALPRPSAYYRRRLTRLEPPYVLNLLLVSALLLVSRKHPLGELLPHFLASVTYTHNLAYAEPSLVNAVAWSLEVECQFYVVAPLLAKVFAVASLPRRRLLIVAAIALGTGAAEYLLPQAPRWQLSLPAHLNYFLCGFLLADLFLVELAAEARRTYGWDAAGLFCWLLILVLQLGPQGFGVLLPIPITLAYLAAFRGRLSGRVFGSPWIYTIGGMCYTIYLYHGFVISLLGRAWIRVPGLAALPVWLNLVLASLVLLPPIAAVCAAGFVLTEKPFMRRDWPARLLSRWGALALRRPDRAENARVPR